MKKQEISILLAEDEPSLQNIFASQLHALGYRKPEFAADGLMAVKLAKQKRFDIIFMDLRMPELDGISATQRIREFEAGTDSRVPIIGLSAYSQRQACLEVGMDEYLQKPVLLYQVEEVLTKFLEIAHEQSKLLNEPVKPKVDTRLLDKSDEPLISIRKKIDELRQTGDVE